MRNSLLPGVQHAFDIDELTALENVREIVRVVRSKLGAAG